MRQDINWDEIQEKQEGEFDRPEPGGYIATIIAVEDNEEKEYLAIEWDFAEGDYKGANQATFDRAGFWPYRLFRSYKEKALGFFKGFKTSVELSNQGYTFQNSNPRGLEGKRMGIVLGEEEYQKKDGSIAVRLYVAQVRTIKAIREGDYKVPELKRLVRNTVSAASASNGFEDDGEELPF